ncbi:unnamed protein product [Allacma fusca]|uniref:C2H2-type domain-containing protein n=1 Tax=Allacma fusca TaxID=39272 RepID=A0A8J2JG77_9HEXA|nr:unnamed protein product [Allacma fusca]
MIKLLKSLSGIADEPCPAASYNRGFPSSQCPKVFTTLKLKNRHQKTHEPKNLKCDICNAFATNDPSNLTRHK